ncbi:flagellar biosynthesis protein FlhF [Motilimonas cestriensis]|uniref:Flagellar biosynthesis protein FlhF n=1 Tax=Motilimonas cestriensis TaxID=2742685 RepID=A0ABS8WBR3_9GAMM|nr:flagellar biosynthesis protein FlhF [Motilimonas cestriensis]MCE2595542.1 flagellar biosynthesis protein FlhF [Motilimonas cestriensis]
MKIKRFFAKDMRAALAEVKDILGPDAVIMSNKKVTGGIEIVAAVDYQSATESKAQPRDVKENRDLKEDSVVLSNRPRANSTQVSSAAMEQAKTINARSGQNLADSLSALLNKQGRATAKPARPSAKPATLMEQNDWEQPKPRPAPTRPLKSAPSNNSKDDKILDSMREEMASLRKLLEHQVSGLMWQELERKEPVRAMLIKWLNKCGFSDDISDQLASCIPESCSPAEAKQYLSQLLEDQVSIGENEILKLGGAVALLGPTGVGKTTTIAKLAARFAMEHGPEQVGLITTDTYRIGAHEQLATYGKILGCSVRVAKDADELSDILYQMRTKRLVLIDTAGMGQRDVRLSEQLETLMKNSRVRIRSFLVIPATSQRRVVQEAIEHFRRIPLSGCILTKLDESLSLGEILSVTIKHALPISYITNGQRVPEDIKIASAKYMVSSALSLMEQEMAKDQHQWYSEADDCHTSEYYE